MRSGFASPLDIRRIDDAHFVLLAPLVYYSAGLAREVTVPAGFVTDFASVPRWIPIAFALFGGIAQAEAVVHDWLYRRGSGVTRREADDTFFEAMTVMGKPDRVRYPMWWGVRIGGWRHFHKKGNGK
jgi:uncharacterized protein DUF1353